MVVTSVLSRMARMASLIFSLAIHVETLGKKEDRKVRARAQINWAKSLIKP